MDYLRPNSEARQQLWKSFGHRPWLYVLSVFGTGATAAWWADLAKRPGWTSTWWGKATWMGGTVVALIIVFGLWDMAAQALGRRRGRKG